MDKQKIGRAIFRAKLIAIAFGYFILGMLQGTFNPLEFRWYATLFFVYWVFIWMKAKINIK